MQSSYEISLDFNIYKPVRPAHAKKLAHGMFEIEATRISTGEINDALFVWFI